MKKFTLLFLIATIYSLSSIAQVSLGSGLALSYSFTGNANDSSGSGLHGTAVGANLTYDRFGNPNHAYDFNGTTDYIRCGNILNSVFAGVGNKFSFSLWIKPDIYMTNNMILAKIADGACGEDQRQFYFRLWAGKIMFGYSSTLTTGNYRYPTGSSVITDTSKWYHIVVLYDGTVSTGGGMDRVQIYLDNISETISVGAASTGTLGNIQVGSSSMGVGNMLNTSGNACSSTFAFDGKIDDLRVYDRLLNIQEIDSLYNFPNPTTGIAIFDKPSEFNFMVYPNPNNGKVNIILKDAVEQMDIKVMNALGQIIYEEAISNMNANNHSINLTTQPKGIYFIRLRTEKGEVTKKITLQ